MLHLQQISSAAARHTGFADGPLSKLNGTNLTKKGCNVTGVSLLSSDRCQNACSSANWCPRQNRALVVINPRDPGIERFTSRAYRKQPTGWGSFSTSCLPEPNCHRNCHRVIVADPELAITNSIRKISISCYPTGAPIAPVYVALPSGNKRALIASSTLDKYVQYC